MPDPTAQNRIGTTPDVRKAERFLQLYRDVCEATGCRLAWSHIDHEWRILADTRHGIRGHIEQILEETE